MFRQFLLIQSFIFISLLLSAQLAEPKTPEATEDWSIAPKVIPASNIKLDIPSDAIILLGNGINTWVKQDGRPTDWTYENGVLTVKPGTGDIYSKQKFEDCHLHLEWRSPLVIKGEGQGRGNSGIFLQSRYEIQILDSYNNETYYNGQAGSIYKQKPPLGNACAKSGEWNTYDIIYRAPEFDLFGTKLKSALVTVIHNGIVVQNNQVIEGTTEYIGFPKNSVHGGAPFMLQDHGDLVSFRNIWVRKL
jgi:Domain of Unknown Function (DUF1080)